MKRYFIIATLAAFLAASTTFAVDKVQKTESKKTEQKGASPKDAKLQPPNSSTAVKPQPAKKESPKKYDDFVDRNNNGVDDRKENLKKK